MPLSKTDVIDTTQIASDIIERYKNMAIGQVNDHVIRMSVMTEDFYWHYHPNSDETFIVMEGTLLLDLDNGTLELGAGQMITVPRNMPHRTRPKDGRSVNLTFELCTLETVKIER